MNIDEHDSMGISLSHHEWLAILAAIDGDRSHRDEAHDALFRHAPPDWCEHVPETRPGRDPGVVCSGEWPTDTVRRNE